MKGKITISRPSNGKHATISIIDDVAGINFCDIEIELESFAEALLGLARVECEVKTRNLDLVGTVREVKTVDVTDLGDKDKSIEPFEIDGWKYSHGFGNHHYATRNGFNVIFKRNIRKE